jgi:hypothetical protein
MDRLEAWLATLQSNFAKGYVVPVNKGLNNWLKVADGFRDTEERAAAAYKISRRGEKRTCRKRERE